VSTAEIERLKAALTLIGNLPLEFNTRARALAQEAVDPPPEGWRDHLTPAEIRKILYREPLHRASKEKDMSTETKVAISGTTPAENETPYIPPQIDMIPVESSNIESVGHDGKETLRVRFKGSDTRPATNYDYVGATEQDFFDIINAESPGRAYQMFTKARGIKGIKL